MIIVFRTNVWNEAEAAYLVRRLKACFPAARINFDLHDVDKVLRVEGVSVCAALILSVLDREGCHCEELV